MIYFPTQGTRSISFCNSYPQMLVIFLRVTQIKPSFPSIPQAFKYPESCCVTQNRLGLGKVVVPCDFQGVERRKKIDRSYGDIVLTVRKNCPNGEHLKVPFWPLT